MAQIPHSESMLFVINFKMYSKCELKWYTLYFFFFSHYQAIQNLGRKREREFMDKRELHYTFTTFSVLFNLRRSFSQSEKPVSYELWIWPLMIFLENSDPVAEIIISQNTAWTKENVTSFYTDQKNSKRGWSRLRNISEKIYEHSSSSCCFLNNAMRSEVPAGRNPDVLAAEKRMSLGVCGNWVSRTGSLPSNQCVCNMHCEQYFRFAYLEVLLLFFSCCISHSSCVTRVTSVVNYYFSLESTWILLALLAPNLSQ